MFRLTLTHDIMKLFQVPHPAVLLTGGVFLAAVLTWVLPAGQYQRHEDPATGRQVVVSGTYAAVEAAPVSAFRAAVAIPRGVVAGAEVVVVILLVGGAWVILDKTGTLSRILGGLAGRLRHNGLLAIPIISLAFATMGALENMQEEIIPLVPVLLLLGRALGFDALTVVAMSLGAANVGSAFSPINPFQAGIALKVSQMPLLEGGGVRLGLTVIAMAIWIALTTRHAIRTRSEGVTDSLSPDPATTRDAIAFGLVLAALGAYVVGVLRFNWGFNELSAVFVVAAVAAGMIGGLGLNGTVEAYGEGFRSVIGAAMLVGVARSISLVLEDGRIIDTILHSLATPLGGLPKVAAAMLMVPVQALIHIPVSSVSGQAVLTLPIMAPLADLLQFSRQAAVMAYQTGAGLTELWTPTNGPLMAILLAAGVPWDRWVRFLLVPLVLLTAIGLAGVFVLM